VKIMVGFCSSPRFVEHLTGPHHPERPDRIRAIHRAVREGGLVDSPDPFPEFRIDLGIKPVLGGPKLIELEPAPIDMRWIEAVHSAAYVDQVRHVSEVGGVLDLGDTPVGPGSFDIAQLSAGAVLRCADAVMTGEVTRAFAAVRPPGHHAEPDRPMGFCLFSNVAIATKYIKQQYGIERVAIVDFDVHHGNGTQAAFESDPSVLFVSIHQHPRTCYPGSGYDWEHGTESGAGFTINLPMPPGAGDDQYIHTLESHAILAIDAFKPQVLMLSAGFDAHREDPLADMELSDEGFARITQLMVELANRHCGGRIVSALEGGYSLPALGRSVVRHLLELARD
jgi:acetoin utilization deacetylase AcuC-like enzyme